MTASASDTPEPQGQGTKAYRAWILAVLVLVYTFNFIDRTILAILAPDIQKEMKLDDTGLGLMLGLPFAVFYSVLGLPIAWLADRFSRTWIMTLSLAIWSGFTAASGLVVSFPQLLMARMGVGVGEAGGVAPGYSIIADYFPARARARALALYALAIPIGSALAVTCGGLIARSLGWRGAFLAVGGIGLLLVPVMRLTVRDPVRPAAAPGAKPGLLATFAILLPKPSFWLLSLGAAASSTLGYGLLAWLPSFFLRSFHLSKVEVSWYYGGILLGGGVVGVWCGGWLADRLGRMNRAAYALVPAGAFLLAIPCFIAALQSPSRTAAFFLFMIPQALALAWLGPITAAIQHLTPASMRSTASSAFLLINNLVGLGLGPLFFGVVSTALKPRYGTESLHMAVLLGLSFYVLAALLLAGAASRMRRDWVD
jgi:predicted MFS family arabinose efflux permease